MKQLTTKVLSGKYKGKSILLPPKDGTRGTKARVKACVFNTLRSKLYNSCFIEGFAGSASMAIEAVSNYAFKAIGIEKDKEAYKLALINAAKFENISIIKGDSLALLENLLVQNEQIILYLDPPFAKREGFDDIYERLFALLLRANLSFVKIIVFEYESGIVLPKSLQDFELFKQKAFGNTSLGFYSRA